MVNLESFFASIKLPSMSEVAHALIQTLNDDDASVGQVRDLIAKDPALSAKLLPFRLDLELLFSPSSEPPPKEANDAQESLKSLESPDALRLLFRYGFAYPLLVLLWTESKCIQLFSSSL